MKNTEQKYSDLLPKIRFSVYNEAMEMKGSFTLSTLSFKLVEPANRFRK